MKFLSLVLTFCISFNVMASTGRIQELEKSLDEYQYAMTVEWDQKDKAFQEKETQKFIEKLSALGLTEKEVMSFAELKFKNAKAIDTLRTRLSLMGEMNSSKEMALALQEASKDLYGQGAAWNGDATEVLLWVGVAVIIGYAVWFSATHECVSWREEWRCDTTDYDTHSSTTCGWHDVCTQYVKK